MESDPRDTAPANYGSPDADEPSCTDCGCLDSKCRCDGEPEPVKTIGQLAAELRARRAVAA